MDIISFQLLLSGYKEAKVWAERGKNLKIDFENRTARQLFDDIKFWEGDVWYEVRHSVLYREESL